MPKQIHVYTKPGCQVCDAALDLLDEAAGRFDVEPVRHNVLADQALFEEYRYAVPVVVVDGVERLRLKFTLAELEAALVAAQVPLRE